MSMGVVLVSCSVMNTPNMGNVYGGNSQGTLPQVEREYQDLVKSYQQDTAGLLGDLINNNPNSSEASIVIENTSPCNMVLSISGNNYFKKIPLGAGKTNGVIVKKGNYRLSGYVCQSMYNQVKNVNESISIKLGN